MQDIADRLETPIDTLVVDIESIRSRIYKVQDQLDTDLAKTLASAAHLDSYKIPIARSRQQMADRQSFQVQHATWESAKIAAQKEKEQYDNISASLPSLT